jgi:broad specificity phosphatase PhoE
LESLSGQTTVYLVRHGQTDWNIQGKLQGHADIQLNEAGRAEALQLSEKMGEIDFTACFASDLQRAVETAQILKGNRSLPTQIDPALRERNFGLWEGRLFCELLEYEAQGRPFLGIEIESDEEIQKRVFSFLHKIADGYPGATILIVTHGGVIRNVLAHVLGIDCTPILSVQMKNTAILKLVTSNGRCEIQEMKDIKIQAAASIKRCIQSLIVDRNVVISL